MNLRAQGAVWERAAEAYLKEQGANVLARNYKRAGGEIDLVVRMGGTIVFVEVKQRSSTVKGTPGEAITHAKRQRICHTALLYLKENRLGDTSARFDVIEILDGQLRHIKGAFPFVPRGGYQ